MHELGTPKLKSECHIDKGGSGTVMGWWAYRWGSYSLPIGQFVTIMGRDDEWLVDESWLLLG